VTVSDGIRVELTQHLDVPGRIGPDVRRGPDEFHVVPLPQFLEGVAEVGEERTRALERAQKDRATLPVAVLPNQSRELDDPLPDPRRRKHQAVEVSLVLWWVHVLARPKTNKPREKTQGNAVQKHEKDGSNTNELIPLKTAPEHRFLPSSLTMF